MTTSDVNNVTVTATTASFYPSMIGHTITATVSGYTYTVTGYTSSTVVTVAPSANASTGVAFTMTADGRYALPSDFGGWEDKPVYAYDAYGMIDLEERSSDVLEALHRDITDVGTTEYYCVVPKAADSSVVQGWWLYVHPITEYTRTVNYRYRAGDVAPTDAAVYPPGGGDFIDALRLCCFAAVELYVSKEPGNMAAMANQAIYDAALLDGSMIVDGALQESIAEGYWVD